MSVATNGSLIGHVDSENPPKKAKRRRAAPQDCPHCGEPAKSQIHIANCRRLGYRSRPISARVSSHEESAGETFTIDGQSFQVEDPVRALLDDGIERLTYFRGNRQEAVDDGDGEQLDHVLQKWIDLETGELQAVLAEGYKIVTREVETDHDLERVMLVEKEVTVEEALNARRAEQGRIGGTFQEFLLDAGVAVELGPIPVRNEKGRVVGCTEAAVGRWSITFRTARETTVQPDDDPNLFEKREKARRSENENPTAGRGGGGKSGKIVHLMTTIGPRDPETQKVPVSKEPSQLLRRVTEATEKRLRVDGAANTLLGTDPEQGQRMRKDGVNGARDPEDVPWKDDTDSDPFGMGVQTVDERDRKTGRLRISWFQEKPVFGPVVAEDGIIEGKVGRQQQARPFSDLIIPEALTWWEVEDDEGRPIEKLTPEAFGDALWEFLPEVKRRVDELDRAEVRGHGTLPWGAPVVRVRVEIPEEMKAGAGLLMSVGRFSRATYFSFNVLGPAVPALRDELDRKCRPFRGTPVGKARKASKRHQRACALARRKLEEERRKAAPKLERRTDLHDYFAPETKGEVPEGEDQEERRKLPPLPEGFTGKCEICRRKIPTARIQAIRELMVQQPVLLSVAELALGLRRCVRAEEVHEGDRIRRRRVRYCDGSDVMLHAAVDRAS